MTSEKNKSIYQMTQEENDKDKKDAIAFLIKGIFYGIGGFCTLWVILAISITAFQGPPEPVLPIVDTVTTYELLLEQEEQIDPPITIPSKPDEQEWIIVKKLVKK